MTSEGGGTDGEDGVDGTATGAVPARAPVTWSLTNRGVMTITLDDPDARNVLNNHSVPMLIEAFEQASVVHEAKRRIIDSIGCLIGGYDAEPSRIARAAAIASSPTPTSSGCAAS